MQMCPDNSFYHRNYEGLKVLIFVPHEDDEINAAGALIYTLARSSAEITLVYATNGDWKYSAATRLKEAAASAAVLGIPEDRIILMGYGDSIANDRRNHIFYHHDHPALSPAGFDTTYGVDGHPDFAFAKTGVHHPYTAPCYLSDLAGIIEEYRPDMIVASDYDDHPDHKMLSLYIDKAIGIIKSRTPDYCPEVWKTFAYALAYSSAADYSSLNNPETQRPRVGVTDKYDFDIIEHFNYSWEDRIRIPVPEKQQGGPLKDNLISEALYQHRSQRIISKADRIINSDEVFFPRRTDNLAYSASVSATSGDVSYLTDFMLYNVGDVDSSIPEFTDCCWQPSENDTRKSVCFEWNEPVDIERIVLYGAVSDDSYIDSVRIRLSDGFETVTGRLPQNGAPLAVEPGRHSRISRCELSVVSASGTGFGLSECEIFASAKPESHIGPFCKITVGDNFAYTYCCEKGADALPVGVYRYGDTGNIRLNVVSGNSVIDGDKLIIDKDDDTIVLRAENAAGDVYDQTVVRVLPENALRRLSAEDKKNRSFIQRQKIGLKFHNMYYILKRQGIGPVVKRTFNNIVRPKLRRIFK